MLITSLNSWLASALHALRALTGRREDLNDHEQAYLGMTLLLCNVGINMHVCKMQKAGYVGKVKIGMDVAASEFFENDKYNLDFKAKNPDPEQIKTGPELQEQYSSYCKQYPIISIEDPFDQDDFDSYANFTSEGVCQVSHCLITPQNNVTVCFCTLLTAFWFLFHSSV